MDWIGFSLITISISGLLIALTYAAYGTTNIGIVLLFFLVSGVSRPFCFPGDQNKVPAFGP